MKQLKNFIPFKIDASLYGWMTLASKPGNADKIHAKLEHLLATDPTGSMWSTIGLVPPIDNLVHDLDGIARMVMVQINERILPGPVLKETLGKMVAELAEKSGRAVTKSEYAQLKDDVEIKLLPKSHIKRTLIPVMVFPDTLMIFTASAKKCDDVLYLLGRMAAVNAKIKFEPHNVACEMSSAHVFRQIAEGCDMSDESGSDNIIATRAIKLRGEDKRTITVKDRDVAHADVQDILGDSALEVIELGMELVDNAGDTKPSVTFTMNDKGVYKGIKLDGIKGLEARENKDDAHTTCWLHGRECKHLFDVMIECHGGLVKPDGAEVDDEEL